jgi:hypothetical protein
MRTSVATLGGISMLFVGVYALSEAAQQSETQATSTSAGATAWDLSTSVFDGIGVAGGSGVVFMGVAAFILVSLGALVSTAGGRR